jgi:hypothetical protein
MCPNLRVHFLSEPGRGPRVVRVEAFQRLRRETSVADILHDLARPMGPPSRTVAQVERVRGGSVHVWRHRWEEGGEDAPRVELLITREGAHIMSAANSPGRDLATGVGFVLTDGALARGRAPLGEPRGR